ncbi:MULTISPECIES: DUF4439 domain-containing protein [Frankia]|uniref:DUF4439 domain-containing protein n=1 Tax=Frankia alni (strain DSM 45986 / CECT 9034 / ACN14a) TaxID=326424 RepID=Q0RDR8_FRAAA|nr:MULTISPECIES: DUF4439 domain-containing protein [Frankia]CAJ64398.1 hypothetical protein; putative signal peptide [Frankia alni ACN14a]
MTAGRRDEPVVAAAGTGAARQSPAAPGQAAAVAALNTMLTATHAAIYAAATAGGALAPLGPPAAGARELARLSWVAHQALRDDLIAAIGTRGGQPAPALPAYRIPTTPVSVAASLTLLAQIEDACAAAAHDATAVLVADARALAVDALGGTAVRAQRARLAAGLPPATATRALPGAS